MRTPVAGCVQCALPALPVPAHDLSHACSRIRKQVQLYREGVSVAIIKILCDQLEFTRPVAAVLRGDIIALMNAYKKLEVPAEDTKKRDKSIPKGLPEAQIDLVADRVKKVQKTL